jgi:hypothetical protein
MKPSGLLRGWEKKRLGKYTGGGPEVNGFPNCGRTRLAPHRESRARLKIRKERHTGRVGGTYCEPFVSLLRDEILMPRGGRELRVRLDADAQWRLAVADDENVVLDTLRSIIFWT